MTHDRLFVLQVVALIEDRWFERGLDHPPTRIERHFRIDPVLFAAADAEAAYLAASEWVTNDGFSDPHPEGAGDVSRIRALGIHQLQEVGRLGELAERVHEPLGLGLPGFNLNAIDVEGVPLIREKEQLAVFRHASASAHLETRPATQADRGSVDLRQGDLFWASPAESRGAVPSIAHPYVVIQDDVLNRSRIHSVVVCALTSNLKRASEPGNVLLDVGEGNLTRQSVVIVSQVSAIDRTQLGERIGSLSDQRVQQVLAGMRFQQASFFTR